MTTGNGAGNLVRVVEIQRNLARDRHDVIVRPAASVDFDHVPVFVVECAVLVRKTGVLIDSITDPS